MKRTRLEKYIAERGAAGVLARRVKVTRQALLRMVERGNRVTVCEDNGLVWLERRINKVEYIGPDAPRPI